MFDLIAAITLSIAAASVIATYSLSFASSVLGRSGIAVTMTLWFAGVLGLGATGVLLDMRWLGIPGLAFAVGIPMALLLGVLLMTRSCRRRVRTAPLPALVAVHALRVLGVWFVLLHAADRLPAPFAPVAGWGDILAGVLALPVAWLAARQPGKSRPISLGWNIIGAIDLVAAVTLGLLSLPGPLRVFMNTPDSGPMNVLPWLLIPGFLVPSLLTLHVVVFFRLQQDAIVSNAR